MPHTIGLLACFIKLKPGIVSNGSKKQGIVDAIHPLALLLTGIQCACAHMHISLDGVRMSLYMLYVREVLFVGISILESGFWILESSGILRILTAAQCGVKEQD